MINSTMDGEPYPVSRFATTLRRKLFRGASCYRLPLHSSQRRIDLSIEHLGLIPPQECSSADPEITSFMRPAPHPNEDETGSEQDDLVADPIADATLSLIYGTANKNTAIFTELFRPVPTNLVRDWPAYDVSHFRIYGNALCRSTLLNLGPTELCPEGQGRACHP